jgi:hypothetical protein
MRLSLHAAVATGNEDDENGSLLRMACGPFAAYAVYAVVIERI